jgi:hypothetical protein
LKSPNNKIVNHEFCIPERDIPFEFLFLSVMTTDKAIDAFLKEQKRESDIWKQNYFTLQVKQEKPSSPHIWSIQR